LRFTRLAGFNFDNSIHLMKIPVQNSVEPAGVEPASKRVAKVLSTCLAEVWLSAKEKYSADHAFAYLLKFRLCIEAYIGYLFVYDASYRTQKSKASGETPETLNLV